MVQKEKIANVYIIPNGCHAYEKRSPPWWYIDREMLRYKLHFFLYLAAVGCAIPYVVVFAKDRVGISASSLGALLTAQMFMFIFTKPLSGYVADYFNRLKGTICVLTIVSGGCYFLLLAIPNYQTPVTPSVVTNGVAGSGLCQHHGNNASSVIRAFVVCQPEVDECFKLCANDSGYSPFIYDKFVCGILVAGPTSECSFKCLRNISCMNGSMEECLDLTCPKYEPRVMHLPTASPCIYNGDLKNLCTFEPDDPDDYTTYQFWLFAVIFTLSSVCSNAIFTLSDTACFETIQKTGADFGQQRLWGAIGWGTAATLSGFVNDSTGDFIVSWILMAVFLSLFLWNITMLDLIKPHFSKNILRDVGTVFQSREFIAFELIILMNGMGSGVIWFYLIWFLTSLGGSELLFGLALAVQSGLGVIPFMFFSKWIIRKIGHFNVLILALAGMFLRFLWYSQLQNPWLVLPSECLHGITYGLYYTALGSYAKMSAKPGTEATTQAIIFGTNEGLGGGVGCVLAGIGFDTIGSHQTFYYFSIFYAGGVVLSLVFSIFLDNRTGVLRLADDADHLQQKGISGSKYESNAE